MFKQQLPQKIILIVFELIVFSAYAWLRADNARIVHEARSFGDTGEYFRIASLPVFSREFWTESKPPIPPLFWKFVDSQPERIFSLQLIVSILCWGVLAFTVAFVIRSRLVKPLAFAIVLAFSLSRDVYMWDPFLGSESLALSFNALFLATALWLIYEWKWQKIALLLFISFLLVFSRDTFAYLLLMITAIILPLFWFSKYRVGVAVLGAGFVVLYLLSSNLAVAGLRPFRAVLMVTALRVYPSEEYTQYFRAHGMPIDERLVKISRSDPDDKFVVYTAFLYDKDQSAYRKWVMERGHAEYIKFLWFYKTDTFQNVFLETPRSSFYPDVYYYTATGYHPIIKDTRLSELLYPTRFALLFFFVANFAAAFIVPLAWRDRRALWLVPLTMILLSYPQAVFIWAGDANDIARHSIPHNVMLRLGVWFLILFIADRFSEWAFSKRKESPVQEDANLS